MKIALSFRRDSNDSLPAVRKMAQAQFTRPDQQAEYIRVPGGALALIHSSEIYSANRFFHRDPAGNWIALTGLPAAGEELPGATLEECCREGAQVFLAHDPELNPDTVRALQARSRPADPVSQDALLTLFYWQVWRWMIEGKLEKVQGRFPDEPEFIDPFPASFSR
jgi:hypothetical protein